MGGRLGLIDLEGLASLCPLLPPLALVPLLSLYDWCEGGMMTVVDLDEPGSMYVRLVRAVM